MKKSSNSTRSPMEEGVFAAIGGFAIGVLISPIGWWAFQVRDWKEGAVLSIVFGTFAAIAGGVLKAKSFESLIATVIRMLNPP